MGPEGLKSRSLRAVRCIGLVGLWSYCGSPVVATEMASPLRHQSIAVKELVPVVLAAASFGRAWSGKHIEFRVDNAAVVSVLNSINGSDPQLMRLIRLMVFLAAKHDFWFSASHIPGRLNSGADAISRNKLNAFFKEVPQTAPSPTTLSYSLVKLVASDVTWSSPLWVRLFNEVAAEAF